MYFQGSNGRHRSLLGPLIDHVPWESSFHEVKTQGQLVEGLLGIKTEASAHYPIKSLLVSKSHSTCGA